MDRWAWDQLAPWLAHRATLPVGAPFRILRGPTRGRPCSPPVSRSNCATVHEQPTPMIPRPQASDRESEFDPGEPRCRATHSWKPSRRNPLKATAGQDPIVAKQSRDVEREAAGTHNASVGPAGMRR